MVGQGSIWLRAPVIGGGYFLLSLLSLTFSRFGAPIESIWLSNALLVAALIASPRREWPVMIWPGRSAMCSRTRLRAIRLDRSLVFLVSDMIECALVATPLPRGRWRSIRAGRSCGSSWYAALIERLCRAVSPLRSALSSASRWRRRFHGYGSPRRARNNHLLLLRHAGRGRSTGCARNRCGWRRQSSWSSVAAFLPPGRSMCRS